MQYYYFLFAFDVREHREYWYCRESTRNGGTLFIGKNNEGK